MTSQPPRRKPSAAVVLATVGALVVAGVAAAVTLAVTNDSAGRLLAHPVPHRVPSFRGPAPRPSSPRHAPRTIETKIGEQVSFVPQDGIEAEVTFSITKITIDGRCTAPYAQKAGNGHFLFLEVAVDTAAETASRFAADLVNTGNFSIAGTDGVTEPGNALSSSPGYGCVPRTRMLPLTLAPGQKYTGTIVLDSRNTRGKLRLTPIGSHFDGDSWQWQLGEGA